MKKRMIAFLMVIAWTVGLFGCSGGNREGERTGHAKLSIECVSAIEKGLREQDKFKDVLPEDGVILAESDVTFAPGESAADLIKRETKERKIQIEFQGGAGSTYVTGVQNLYQMDAGEESGWMWSVNGEFPSQSLDQYELQEGDVVALSYVTSFTALS